MYFADAVSTAVPPPARAARPVGAALAPVQDSATIPFRWICRIRVQAERGHGYGTGLLVSPWHVLTAAHVIYMPQEPDTSRTIEVGPGYGPYSRTSLRSNGWAVDPNWNVRDCMTAGSDLALIRLAKPVDRAIGFASLGAFAPGGLFGRECFVAGYPARRDDVDATRLFLGAGHIRGSIVITACSPGRADGHMPPSIVPASLLIAHDADSGESMSGSPVWVMDQDTPRIVAVHTGTVADGNVKKAVLLSERIQAEIQAWIRGSLRPV